MKPLDLLIADSAPLYRQGLKLLLTGAHTRIREADSIHGVQRCLDGAATPDIVIIDARLSGLQSFAQLAAISAHSATLLLVDGTVKLAADRLRSCGVRGVMTKTAPTAEVQRAVRQLVEGAIWWSDDGGRPAAVAQTDLTLLTQCEGEIAALVGQGLLNKQIASRLKRSESTVKRHLSNIYRKTAISGRSTLALQTARIARASN